MDDGAKVKANKIQMSDLRRYRPTKILKECECFHSNRRIAVRSEVESHMLFQIVAGVRTPQTSLNSPAIATD